MRIYSLHQRDLAVPARRVASLLEELGTGRDRLWPSNHWPPLLLDRPIAIGASGGHGPIRYDVECLEPGSVRFRLTGPPGFTGTHEFDVAVTGSGCRLRHVIDGSIRGWMLLRWPLVFGPLHHALMEDALDNAERAVAGAVATPARWSAWVRLLRWAMGRRRRQRRSSG